MRKEVATLIWTLVFFAAAQLAPFALRKCQAQLADPSFPATNGSVYALALRGDTLYVGGAFSAIGGAATGSYAAFDPLTAQLRKTWPRVIGLVICSASDGRGGWYIGGHFSSIMGLPRSNLAHVRADGSLDAWNPGADGYVWSMCVNGGRVYVGGTFTTIAGQAHNYLAAIDTVLGNVLPWDPRASGTVFSLASNGSVIYAGGTFTAMGGRFSQNGIAAIEASSGTVLPWNPGITGSSPSVYSILPGEGTVIIGGYFGGVGGQPRSCVAALDSATAAPLPWTADANAVVYALGLNGGVLYVGGAFTSIAGQARTRLAAIEMASDALTPWNPRANDTVLCLVIDGLQAFVGGRFTAMGDSSRSNLAAVDLATGNVQPWKLDTDGQVNMLVADASGVYAGGNFASLGAQPRSNLAAIRCSTGELLSWNPGVNAAVSAIAVSGSNVYVGGSFSLIGGQLHSSLAGIDARSGVPLSWNFDTNGTVLSLAADDSSVYVGGSFTTMAGQTHANFAAIDNTVGAVRPWNAQVSATVRAIALSGTSVYMAGDFGGVGGLSRLHLAQVDGKSGTPLSWVPNASSTASALLVNGASVDVGGDFAYVGNFNFVGRLCSVDAASGVQIRWTNGGTDDRVNAFAMIGSHLFVGGAFYSIGGVGRPYIAAVDGATGVVQPWDFGASDPVLALASQGTTLYIGGYFTSIGQIYRQGLARVPDPSGYLPLSISLSAPSPGQVFNVGDLTTIQWVSSGGNLGVLSVDLYVSRSGPSGPWELIGAGIANTGSFVWTVSGPPAGNAYMRIDARDYAGIIKTAYSGPIAIGDLATPTLVQMFQAAWVNAGVRVEWRLGDASAFETIGVARAPSANGGYRVISLPTTLDGLNSVMIDTTAAREGTWWYRLQGVFRDGSPFAGEAVSVNGEPATELELLAPWPNPSSTNAFIRYAVPRDEYVRLEIIDAQGRAVRTLANGVALYGRYSTGFSTAHLAPGVYFLKLHSPQREIERRFVVMR